MNKSELIQALYAENNITIEEAEMVVSTFFGLAREALTTGKRVELRGFGAFAVKKYGGYLGRNPKTGKRVDVKEKVLPVFRPGLELKRLLNES